MRTEGFIKNLSRIEDNSSLFEMLIKKIDLGKNLYQEYSEDLKKVKMKKEISSDSYKKVYKLLSESRDFKFINTAAKLNDFLLKKDIITKKKHRENFELLLKEIRNIDKV